MKIIGNNWVEVEGPNVTEEDLRIAKMYDVYTQAIESFTQLKEAEERNERILNELKERGVKKVRFTYTPMFSNRQNEKEFDLENDKVTVSCPSEKV